MNGVRSFVNCSKEVNWRQRNFSLRAEIEFKLLYKTTKLDNVDLTNSSQLTESLPPQTEVRFPSARVC